MGPATIIKWIQYYFLTCGPKNCINKFVFMCNYVIFTWNYKYIFFIFFIYLLYVSIRIFISCTIFKWKIIMKYHGHFFLLYLKSITHYFDWKFDVYNLTSTWKQMQNWHIMFVWSIWNLLMTLKTCCSC